jgi:hypothetical protein
LTCIFTSICWYIKSYYGLSTKLKQKYNLYHWNNLKDTIYSQIAIIIFFQNIYNYNLFHVNCYLKATCNILFFILFEPINKIRFQTCNIVFTFYFLFKVWFWTWDKCRVDWKDSGWNLLRNREGGQLTPFFAFHSSHIIIIVKWILHSLVC